MPTYHRFNILLLNPHKINFYTPVICRREALHPEVSLANLNPGYHTISLSTQGLIISTNVKPRTPRVSCHQWRVTTLAALTFGRAALAV